MRLKRQVSIAVIDGQGGGMGRALVERIRREHPTARIRALGTNATATAAMMKAGADDGATGENAVIFNVGRMDVLIAPIGVAMANGLLGEVTPEMAAAVMDSGAVKIFLPPQKQCGFHLAGGSAGSLQACLDDALRILREELAERP